MGFRGPSPNRGGYPWAGPLNAPLLPPCRRRTRPPAGRLAGCRSAVAGKKTSREGPRKGDAFSSLAASSSFNTSPCGENNRGGLHGDGGHPGEDGGGRWRTLSIRRLPTFLVQNEDVRMSSLLFPWRAPWHTHSLRDEISRNRDLCDEGSAGLALRCYKTPIAEWDRSFFL